MKRREKSWSTKEDLGFNPSCTTFRNPHKPANPHISLSADIFLCAYPSTLEELLNKKKPSHLSLSPRLVLVANQPSAISICTCGLPDYGVQDSHRGMQSGRDPRGSRRVLSQWCEVSGIELRNMLGRRDCVITEGASLVASECESCPLALSLSEEPRTDQKLCKGESSSRAD